MSKHEKTSRFRKLITSYAVNFLFSCCPYVTVLKLCVTALAECGMDVPMKKKSWAAMEEAFGPS